MSDAHKPRPSERPGGSGEHKAVQIMRAKFESFNENQLAELRALAERTRRISENVPPPPRTDGPSDPDAELFIIPPDSQVPKDET